MSLFVASLNSGSNGNCYYIGNEQEAILVDAGLSCKETEKRMRRLDLTMNKVKALFVSHEHGDHISGVVAIARKYQLPVYITSATLHQSGLPVDVHLAMPFGAYRPINIGGLSVIPFPKQHDAAEPHSFIVSGDGVNIGVFTDIGVVCDEVTHHFRQCHAVFLEANYDAEMLENGRYPIHLKNRIRDGKGHLSNHQALALFTQHRHPSLSHIFLSHLSKNNNDPELAHKLFSRYALETNIIVASRYEETAVYHIVSGTTEVYIPPRKAMVQASLF